MTSSPLAASVVCPGWPRQPSTEERGQVSRDSELTVQPGAEGQTRQRTCVQMAGPPGAERRADGGPLSLRTPRLCVSEKRLIMKILIKTQHARTKFLSPMKCFCLSSPRVTSRCCCPAQRVEPGRQLSRAHRRATSYGKMLVTIFHLICHSNVLLHREVARTPNQNTAVSFLPDLEMKSRGRCPSMSEKLLGAETPVMTIQALGPCPLLPPRSASQPGQYCHHRHHAVGTLAKGDRLHQHKALCSQQGATHTGMSGINLSASLMNQPHQHHMWHHPTPMTLHEVVYK